MCPSTVAPILGPTLQAIGPTSPSQQIPSLLWHRKQVSGEPVGFR